MTTKTTNASSSTLPIFENPQCNTEEDFNLFAEHLSRWCAQWVPSIGVPIMRKARDLYDNTAVCIILDKWYELKLNNARDQHERLMRAATGSEYSWEQEGEEDEFSEGSLFERNHMNSYNDALYTLLIR